jgi:NAD(P)-dependent dehydrogenase (short-subunit alcohol dehydrogenase family)
MTTEPIAAGTHHARALEGQTVVVVGGSAGIGLATARAARSAGADVILTARSPERLQGAADEVGAVGTATFDALARGELERFFDDLAHRVDHVMVTAGQPFYAPLPEMDFEAAGRWVADRLLLPLRLARHAAPRVREGGSLVFMGATGSRPVAGLSLGAAVGTGMRPLIANLALEIAPVRINLIGAGFVGTPLSASLLGDGLDERLEQLRQTLPIGRVVSAEDVAALAIEVMSNTALTGATYYIDGGQQLIS